MQCKELRAAFNHMMAGIFGHSKHLVRLEFVFDPHGRTISAFCSLATDYTIEFGVNKDMLEMLKKSEEEIWEGYASDVRCGTWTWTVPHITGSLPFIPIPITRIFLLVMCFCVSSSEAVLHKL